MNILLDKLPTAVKVTGARVQIPLSPPKVANLLGLAAFLFLLLNCKNGGKLLKILLLQYMALDR